MVFFNWATMQMAAKIVYYGPGLCGKTSNLSYIYAKTAPNSRGEMVSLETESDRTLFFDLLPIEVGTIGGFKTRLQLYTVPGQVFYNTTRKLVLKGVDGLVFVADSQRPMREANLESIASLRDNLSELGLDMDELPLVLQYNKRDLKNVLTLEELNEDLNPNHTCPFFESSAINGDGVFETLKEITKLTLKKLRRRMAAPQPTPQPRPATTLRAAATVTSASRPSSSISAASLAAAAEGGFEGDELQPVTAAPLPEMAPVMDFSAAMTVEEPPVADAFAAPLEVEIAADEIEELPEELAEPVPGEPDPLAVTVDVLYPSEAPFQLDEAPEIELAGEPVVVEESQAQSEDASPFEEPGESFVVEVPAMEPVEEIELLSPALATTAEAAVEIGLEQVAVAMAETAAEAQPEPEVDFERTDVDITPPPVKRVQVSNQMDILAELDDLRKQATMDPTAKRKEAARELDLDSLLGGAPTPKPRRIKELRHKVEKGLNSDIFKRMRNLQVAIRIQDAKGETIHSLEPVSLEVGKSGALEKLSLQFLLDLENQR